MKVMKVRNLYLFLPLMVLFLSSNTSAIPDDGNKKTPQILIEKQIEINGTPSVMDDDLIRTLLTLFSSIELANAQYTFEEYGISIANCQYSKCSDSITKALSKANKIYSNYATRAMNFKANPSYILPIVQINGRDYLFANKHAFGRSDFNTIVSKDIYINIVGPMTTIFADPIGVVPMTNADLIYLIIDDLCRYGQSSRIRGINPPGNLHSYIPDNFSLDLSIFDKAKTCPNIKK